VLASRDKNREHGRSYVWNLGERRRPYRRRSGRLFARVRTTGALGLFEQTGEVGVTGLVGIGPARHQPLPAEGERRIGINRDGAFALRDAANPVVSPDRA